MKIVINKCYGGFSLSPMAVRRLAELQGRECHFFTNPREPLNIHKLVSISQEQAEKEFMWFAYDVADAERFSSPENWHDLPMETRQKHNDEASAHSLGQGREVVRHDPNLIKVVEELGDKANGTHARLSIVEIPDDIDYEVEEYDGNEHIAEVHKTWR